VTSYCFRVLATNAAGTTAPGPASEAFTTAAGPPDPPAGLRRVQAAPFALELAWDAAGPNGEEVTMYSVERTVAGDDAWEAVGAVRPDGDGTGTTLAEGLKPMTVYLFRAAAANALGQSAFSAPSAPLCTQVRRAPRCARACPSKYQHVAQHGARPSECSGLLCTARAARASRGARALARDAVLAHGGLGGPGRPRHAARHVRRGGAAGGPRPGDLRALEAARAGARCTRVCPIKH